MLPCLKMDSEWSSKPKKDSRGDSSSRYDVSRSEIEGEDYETLPAQMRVYKSHAQDDLVHRPGKESNQIVSDRSDNEGESYNRLEPDATISRAPDKTNKRDESHTAKQRTLMNQESRPDKSASGAMSRSMAGDWTMQDGGAAAATADDGRGRHNN